MSRPDDGDPAADPPAQVELVSRAPHGRESAAPEELGSRPPSDPPRRGPPVFSLEGRAAPGLYLVGWLGVLVGLGGVTIGILGGAGPLFALGLVVLAVGLLAAAGAQALERARRPDLSYRGPSPWLVFAAVIPISFLIQLALVSVLRFAGVTLSLPVLSALLLALTALSYALVVRLLVVGTGALSWRDMGLGIPASRVLGDLVYGAVFAVPVLFGAGLLVQLLGSFLALPDSPLPEASGAVDIAANLVAAAVIAPIGEELFFRGYATTAWARSRGRERAIVLGALFFSLAHVLTIGSTDPVRAIQAAVVAFVIRVPVGLVLGWLFLSRRSLAAPIGLHATYNAIPVLVLAAASGAA